MGSFGMQSWIRGHYAPHPSCLCIFVLLHLVAKLIEIISNGVPSRHGQVSPKCFLFNKSSTKQFYFLFKHFSSLFRFDEYERNFMPRFFKNMMYNVSHLQRHVLLSNNDIKEETFITHTKYNIINFPYWKFLIFTFSL